MNVTATAVAMAWMLASLVLAARTAWPIATPIVVSTRSRPVPSRGRARGTSR